MLATTHRMTRETGRKHGVNRRSAIRGFTLIELMIVIGIIAVMVAVMALAVLPWLSKSEEKATTSIMQQVGGLLSDTKTGYNVQKFRKDAGKLASGINDQHASAQLMVFYFAPSKEVWDAADYYKNQNYSPKVQPADWAAFIKQDGNQLPHLCDAWGTPLKYMYDKTASAIIVESAGEDMKFGTDDDFVFDGRNNTVKKREEFNK